MNKCQAIHHIARGRKGNKCCRCLLAWEPQGCVAHDASALVCKVKEGGWPLVARHDGQGTQQQNGMGRHPPIPILPQQSKDSTQILPCHRKDSISELEHFLPRV